MTLKQIFQYFRNDNIDIRVRMFYLIDIIGILASVLGVIVLIVNKQSYLTMVPNVITLLVVLIALFLAVKKKKYNAASAVIIFGAGYVVIPFMFFLAGGYEAGMPPVFLFTTCMICLLSRGKKSLIFSAVSIAEQTLCMYVAHIHPEWVIHLEGTDAAFLDLFQTFIYVGMTLSIVLISYLSSYDRQRVLAEKQKQTELELEVAKRTGEAKTDFLFNMSHDIRTPMNAIIGFTNLMEHHLDNRELVEEYIKKIKTSNDIMLSIINNILDMARIESGKEHVEEIEFDVLDIGKDVVSVFVDQMKEKDITFEREIHLINRYVYADVTKVKNILLNLLSNAYKYTPSGGTVKISANQYPADKPGFIIMETVVQDTGIGMSKDFQKHMFESFSREHTSTQSKKTGTGLGMTIVKNLVDLMNGTIEVESEQGKGTTFTVRICHRIVEKVEGLEKEKEKIVINKNLFAGKRILLAEDNELNAEITITILEEAGFIVEHAEDGITCFEKVKNSESGYFDLIIMDIQMPNMDGYKTTQAIRNLDDSSKAQIPILALTANAFDEDKKNALAAGMNGHIAKPIDVEVLMSVLTTTLSEFFN